MILADFSFSKFEDGTLTVTLVPPVPLGGQSIEFNLTKRFGSDSALLTKSLASGFNNVSGLNLINSGAGIFTTKFDSVDTSGLAFGNYAGTFKRTNSGSVTILSEGYLILQP